MIQCEFDRISLHTVELTAIEETGDDKGHKKGSNDCSEGSEYHSGFQPVEQMKKRQLYDVSFIATEPDEKA